jgi:ATP-dependent Clp protease ATP-binding subunit ClpC
MLEQFAKRLEKNDIEVQVTDSVKDLIVKKGYDTVYGARPLRRSIQSMIEDRIAEEMLEGNVKNGDKVLLDAKQDEIAVTVTSSSR